jgi:hypothetical protein
MNLKINDYRILLEGLTKLGGNDKLQEELTKHIEFLVKYNAENEGKLTGFKELDYPDMS